MIIRSLALFFAVFLLYATPCSTLTIVKIKNKSDAVVMVSLVGDASSVIEVAPNSSIDVPSIAVPRTDTCFTCIQQELGQYLKVTTKKCTFLIAEGYHAIGGRPSPAVWVQYLTPIQKKKGVVEYQRNSKVLFYSYGTLSERSPDSLLPIKMIIESDGMIEPSSVRS
jgi:hypothetical protein